MYFLYIIKCADNSLYTGITTDIDRRMREHKEGSGAKYTRRGVKKLLYTEKFRNRSKASKREAQIKSWTRTQKIKLIKGFAV